MATSLPSSVSSRVCHTWVRRPRCTGVAVAITVAPSLAPPIEIGLALDRRGALGVFGKIDDGGGRADRVGERHYRTAVDRVMQGAKIRPHQHFGDHAVF